MRGALGPRAAPIAHSSQAFRALLTSLVIIVCVCVQVSSLSASATDFGAPVVAICRVASKSATQTAADLATPPTPSDTLGGLASHLSERGARWQWSGTAGDHVLLDSFDAPWTTTSETAAIIEGWFEAPATGSVSFLMRRDAIGSLRWSGNETAAPIIPLAGVSTIAADVRRQSRTPRARRSQCLPGTVHYSWHL